MIVDRAYKKSPETIIPIGQIRGFAPMPPQIDGLTIGNLQEKPLKLMNSSDKLDQTKGMENLRESNLEKASYYFSQKDWERTIVACQDILDSFPQQAEAYKIWGNALQKQGKITESMGYYAKALEIQPNMPEIYVNLGSIYAQKKQWQKAICYFQQALEFKPDFDGAYRNLARVWAELGNSEKAVEANYRAYQITPERYNAGEHYLLGRQLLSQQRLDEALVCYRQAIAQQSDWLEAYEHLANLLEKLGQWEEAVTYRRQIVVLQRQQRETLEISPREKVGAKRAFGIVPSKATPKTISTDIVQFYLEQAQQNPESAEIHIILGSLFEQKQQWKQAIFFYRKSLQIDGRQAKIYDKIAQILLKFGREDVAADCWIRFLSLSGENADPKEYINLGNLYQKLNNIDAASYCYRRALKLQPQLIAAYDRLAEISLSQNDTNIAIEIYKTALKYNPQNSSVYYNLGKLLASTERWQDAVACYQKSIAIDADFWQAYHELGDALSHQKLWQEAANAYRLAINLKPDFFWSHNNLGDILIQLKDPTEAITVLQKALKLKQDFHWTYSNLGTAYLSLQRWEEAIFAYSRTLKLQPQSKEAAERLNFALQQKAAADSHLAFELYLEALERDPDDIESYQQALEIHNDRPELYLGLAEAYYRQQEWMEALINYQYAYELQPNNSEIAAKLLEIRVRLNPTEENIGEKRETVDRSDEKDCPNLAQTNFSELSTYIRDERGIVMLDSLTETFIQATPMRPLDDLRFCLLPVADATKIGKVSFLQSVEVNANEESHYLLAADTTVETEIEDSIQFLPASQLGDLLTPLLPQASQKVFSLLQVYRDYPQLGKIETIAQICQQARKHLPNSNLQIDQAYWLSPNLLYIEASIRDIWLSGKINVFAATHDHWALGSARAFQIEEQKLVIFAVFAEEIYTSPHTNYSLIVDIGTTKLTIDGDVFAKAYSLEFIEFLNKKPEHQKHLIRDEIAKTILAANTNEPVCKEDCANLLQKLQYFVQITPAYPNNPCVPFQMLFDHIVPIEQDGVFISGWMQNPYDLLESLEVFSDLGFNMSISKKDIYKLERHDVAEHLKSTPYGSFNEKHGFCAYIPVPEDIRQKLVGLAKLHSFRFCVHLKGRIRLEYTPVINHQDVHSARSTIVHIAPSDKIDAAMLNGCIAPAAAKLQKYCMESSTIREVETYGTPIAHPLISIIIPLYKCLDFLKVQFATMANDSSIRDNCELIYVLDSPEQDCEVKNLLQHYCLLYQLPATLVIVARNSGYAAANNFGASQARGKYLILLNSDVFPKHKGWAVKMAKFYAANPNIGTLAPKLLYEDDSLQHAGMYFEKTTFPFWLTLHYYKGFPNAYAPACTSRVVPAVTGACLMVTKELYDRVGGLTTDYVIGDFEDSDLCFKCTSLGYESWYYADAELYHLERQSVPLNSVYAHSVAWQYNARLHESRWGSLIDNLQSSIG
jgi:tetratricopeptide (TPR) repeat protein/GT2 family glycosyltransferase